MVNSFFVRVAIFQFLGFIVYAIGFLLWVYFVNLPDFNKRIFDSQQETLTKGLADITDGLNASTHEFHDFFRKVENIIVDTSNASSINSGKKTNYVQLISIHNEKNNLVYASEKHPFLDILPLSEAEQTVETEGQEWYVFSRKSDKKGYHITLAESKEGREALLGDPFGDVLKFFLMIVIIMGITILISAYYTLKPLRHTAKNIASRSLREVNMLDLRHYYIEIRPIINEINLLMSKLHLASLREKRFLADAAHELRTPVAAIQTQLYLLIHLNDPDEKNGVVQDMHTTISRISSLSNQLINISRVESEEGKLNKEIVCVNNSINQCINYYMKYALEKNILIRFETESDVIIYNDKQLLSTVLSNLLDNAIKYTDIKGNINIRLMFSSVHDCKISIHDDGAGIPSQYIPMIFNRFYRVPGTTQSGSGLGLAIAKNLTQKMGGMIEVGDGLNGRGVGFIITLPMNTENTITA